SAASGLGALLRAVWARALSPHRSGGHRGSGERRRRAPPPRCERAVARRGLLVLRRIRRSGGVTRDDRAPGDPRRGGCAPPRHPLSGFTVLALSALADARIPGHRRG